MSNDFFMINPLRGAIRPLLPSRHMIEISVLMSVISFDCFVISSALYKSRPVLPSVALVGRAALLLRRWTSRVVLCGLVWMVLEVFVVEISFV